MVTSQSQKRVKYRVSHKKGIDKKLLFGAAQGLNLQILNLFGFRLYLQVLFGVSFKEFGHICAKLWQFFVKVCVILAFKFNRKTATKFQKCFCVTLFQEFVTDYYLE